MRTSATSAQLARQSAGAGLVDELGAWHRGAGPVYRQLARAIAHGVDRGALAAGRRLPSERELARLVSVSRGTAVAAYDQLVADGHIERRRGSGTFVVGAPGGAVPEDREGTALVHRLVDASAEPVGATTTDVVDLSLSVLHDASTVGPFELTGADLDGLDPASGYSPWGIAALRASIAAHVTGWGLPTTADQVVVTTGAQQAISVAAACWVRPGDTVVVDDPTYPGAIAAFAQAGARLVGVPVDAGGPDPVALEAALARHPALVYLQPTVHSPTGVTAGSARRARLATVLAEARVPFVEDLALADLAWTRPPPPVATLVPGSPTMVVGSLGKRFWGGLRLGFVRAPEPLALRTARIKATHDLGTSAVSQVLAARLLAADGRATRPSPADELRRRYDVLAGALQRALPTWRWRTPTGGLSIWVDLGADDGADFARTALAHGVAVAAPEPLSCSGGWPHHIRLSFAPPPRDLTVAVARLASAWQDRHLPGRTTPDGPRESGR